MGFGWAIGSSNLNRTLYARIRSNDFILKHKSGGGGRVEECLLMVLMHNVIYIVTRSVGYL